MYKVIALLAVNCISMLAGLSIGSHYTYNEMSIVLTEPIKLKQDISPAFRDCMRELGITRQYRQYASLNETSNKGE